MMNGVGGVAVKNLLMADTTKCGGALRKGMEEVSIHGQKFQVAMFQRMWKKHPGTQTHTHTHTQTHHHHNFARPAPTPNTHMRALHMTPAVLSSLRPSSHTCPLAVAPAH